MTSVRASAMALLSILVFASSGSADNQAANPVRERFLHEAPSAWAVLEEWDKELEIEGQFFEDPRYPQRKKLFRFARKGDLMLAEESGAPSGDSSKITSGLFALGPDYGFWLQRKSSDSPWVVLYLYPGDKKTDAGREIYRRYALYINPHDHVGAIPLTRLDKEEGFSWTDFQVVRRDGKEFVKASYRKLNHYRREKRSIPVSGYLILDPDNSWACVESSASLLELVRQGAQRSGHRVSYADIPLGRVRPFTRVESFVSWDGKNEQKSVFEVTQVRRATVDDSAFTLSGYGLPELVKRPVQTGWSLWLWVLLAASGVLALGGLFRWLWRRTA
ncbi:MAG TPA: hypothetical protein VNK04_03160 [Gemmataceae bacterium]|nr:hypothetical protein [Gemmataceae bacterium]